MPQYQSSPVLGQCADPRLEDQFYHRPCELRGLLVEDRGYWPTWGPMARRHRDALFLGAALAVRWFENRDAEWCGMLTSDGSMVF